MGLCQGKGESVAERTCFNCVYAVCDPCLWLRWLDEGETIVPQCANHPQWPGELHDVPGVPCRSYRPKPIPPAGPGVRMIPLTDGGYAYVDAADYDWLNQWKWHLSGGYAARREENKTIFMHHLILPPPQGRVTDHIDGNRVNNCRWNLRSVTRTQNMQNKRKHAGSSSQFKGVFYNRGRHKWFAKVRCGGQYHRRGYFDIEEEAARAYDHLAVEWFGEFARLNFPREWPPERRAEVHARRQETSEEVRSKKAKGKSKKGGGGRTKPRAGGRNPKRSAHQATKTQRKPARK